MRKAPVGGHGQKELKGRGWGSSQSPSPGHHGATSRPWFPQMLPSRHVRPKTQAAVLNGSIQWADVKDAHTDVTSASSPSCCPSQKTQRLPVGTRPGKGLAVPQRASLSPPEAPGRTLPHQTTGRPETGSPGKRFARASLTLASGAFSALWSGGLVCQIPISWWSLRLARVRSHTGITVPVSRLPSESAM